MGGLADGTGVLDAAVVVGLLEVDAGGVRAQGDGGEVRAPILLRQERQLHAGAETVGAHGFDGLGVRAGGDIGAVPLPVPAHGQGLGGGGGAVIDGGVGDFHARQGADHGLVFEDGLEDALADLGLVGGIGGDQLLPAGDALHHGGDEVPVGPRAPKDGGVDAVPGGHGGHLLPHGQLTEPLGQVQPVHQHFPGHGGEELLHRARADGGEHGPPLSLRIRDIASHNDTFPFQRNDRSGEGPLRRRGGYFWTNASYSPAVISSP